MTGIMSSLSVKADLGRLVSRFCFISSVRFENMALSTCVCARHEGATTAVGTHLLRCCCLLSLWVWKHETCRKTSLCSVYHEKVCQPPKQLTHFFHKIACENRSGVQTIPKNKPVCDETRRDAFVGKHKQGTTLLRHPSDPPSASVPLVNSTPETI